MSRAMSRSGRPPLAGGSAVAAGKNISKLLRHALSSRCAVDRAKLLANLASDRAGRLCGLSAQPIFFKINGAVTVKASGQRHSRWRNSRCSGELGRGCCGGVGEGGEFAILRMRVLASKSKERDQSDPHVSELSTQQQKTKYVREIC